MKRKGLFVVVQILFLLVSAYAFAGGVELRYKFKPGENIRYSWEQNQEVTVKGMPAMPNMQQGLQNKNGDMKVNMSSKGRIKYHVVELLDNNKARVEVNFEEFTTSTNVAGAPTTQIDNLVRNMVFEYTMDNLGKVYDIKMRGYSPMTGQNDFVETLKNSLVQSQAVLPKEPVKKGSTWNSTFGSDITMPMGGKAKISGKVVYKVVKIGKWHGHKAVFVNADITISLNSPKDPATGKPIMEGSGKFKAEGAFLYDIGRIGYYNTNGIHTIKMNMPVGMGPSGPKVQEMTQEIKLNNKIELIEYK